MVEYHNEDKAMYRLTDRGREWFNGDLLSEELEKRGSKADLPHFKRTNQHVED